MTCTHKYTGILCFCIVIMFCTGAVSFGSSDDAAGKTGDETTIKEMKSKIGAAAESIRDYTAEQRDQAVAKAQQQLNELDRNVDQLEKKVDRQWDQLSADAKQKWQETRITLQKKRVEAAEWFGGVKRGSAEAWEEVKKGYANAYSELSEGWEKAKEEFEDKQK